eukprot:488960_1
MNAKLGRTYYRGPKGGIFSLTESGNKAYLRARHVKEDAIGTDHEGRILHIDDKGIYYYFDHHDEYTECEHAYDDGQIIPFSSLESTQSSSNDVVNSSISESESSSQYDSYDDTDIHELVLCGNLLNKLMKRADTKPFREPVDWKGLNLPDYPLFITKPMDLGTIATKLECNKYSTADQFAYDVRLVFKNAKSYNMEGYWYLLADGLLKRFERSYAKLAQYLSDKKHKSLEYHVDNETTIEIDSNKILERNSSSFEMSPAPAVSTEPFHATQNTTKRALKHNTNNQRHKPSRSPHQNSTRDIEDTCDYDDAISDENNRCSACGKQCFGKLDDNGGLFYCTECWVDCGVKIKGTTHVNLDSYRNDGRHPLKYENVGNAKLTSEYHRLVSAHAKYDQFIEQLNKYNAMINDNEEKHNMIDIPNTLEMLNTFTDVMQHAAQNEKLASIFEQLDHCDVSKCDMFERNGRNLSENDDHGIASFRIMDKIHCFCHHSYDTGNRLSIEDQNALSQSRNENPKQSPCKTLKDILSTKNTDNANQMRQRMCKKYNQIHADTHAQNQYVFGCEFDYGNDHDEKQTPNGHQNKIHLSPKYGNLKEELTANHICRITIHQYRNEWNKMQLHYQTKFRKKHYSMISEQHLLSLMIYCNFDSLQFEFSKTYRDHCGVRHDSYYHLGLFLKEAVLRFGTSIQDSRLQKKSFYHGISQQLVPTEIVGDLGKGVAIYCPLSTSTSFTVAVNTFTNQSQGLVIEFGGDRSQAKYFNVSWLSDHANENECLFLQNKHELRINNITNCQLGHDYKHILDALKTMDCILADDYYQDDDVIKTRRESMTLLTTMIENQLSSNATHCSEYEKQLLNVYFTCKRVLRINYEVLKQNYPELFELFIEEEWINVRQLCNLFPNVVHVRIKHINLCPKVMDRIFECYQSNDMRWNLKRMMIKIDENSRLSVNSAISRYYKRFAKLNRIISAREDMQLQCNDTLLIESR